MGLFVFFGAPSLRLLLKIFCFIFPPASHFEAREVSRLISALRLELPCRRKLRAAESPSRSRAVIAAKP